MKNLLLLGTNKKSRDPCVFLFYIQLNHTQTTFIQRCSHLIETVFQLGIGILIFDKRLIRVFVDVQVTKILFQLGIIGIDVGKKSFFLFQLGSSIQKM